MTQTRLMTQLPMTRLDLQIVVVPAIEGNRGVDAHPGISPPDARSGIIIAGCPRWMDEAEESQNPEHHIDIPSPQRAT